MGLVPVIYIPPRRSQRVPESPGGRNWTGETISFFKWGSRTKWAELDISNSFHLDSSSLFFLPVSIFLTSKIVGSFSFSSFFLKNSKKHIGPETVQTHSTPNFLAKKKNCSGWSRDNRDILVDEHKTDLAPMAGTRSMPLWPFIIFGK